MMKNSVDLLIYFVLFSFLTTLISCEISDKRLCADPECRTLLSLAKTLIRYNSVEDGVLSFPINKEVRVFSKSAGTNPELWGVEIQGQRGYVNKKMIREYRVLIKNSDLTYEVPTELEALRLKKLEKEKAKLQSSEPEPVQATVEQTTTAPLPENVADNVVVDEAAHFAEASPGNPTRVKKEVIDGTTVLVPVIDEQANEVPEVRNIVPEAAEATPAPVNSAEVPPPPEATPSPDSTKDSQAEEEEDDVDDDEEEEEILAEDDDEDEESVEVKSKEEASTSEGESKSNEETAKSDTADSATGSSESEPAVEQIKVNEEVVVPEFKPVPDATMQFLSAELGTESKPTVQDDVKPVTEEVDETPLNVESPPSVDNAASTNPEVTTTDEQNSTEATILTEQSASEIPSATEQNVPEKPVDAEPVVESLPEPVTVTPAPEAVNDQVENTTDVNPPTENLVAPADNQGIIPETVNNGLNENANIPDNTINYASSDPNLVPVESAREVPTIPMFQQHHHYHDHNHHNHDHSVPQSNDYVANNNHYHAHDHAVPSVDPYAHAHTHDHHHDHSHQHYTEQPIGNIPADVANEFTTPTYHDHNVPNPMHVDTVTPATTLDDTTAAPPASNFEYPTEPSLLPVDVQSSETIEPQQPETYQPVETHDQHEVEQPTTTTEHVPEQQVPEVNIEPENVSRPDEPENVPKTDEPVNAGTEPVVETQGGIEAGSADVVETKGLFDTMLDTVNSFWSQSKTEEKPVENFDDALDKLLFPDRQVAEEQPKKNSAADDGFCENLSPNAPCPGRPNYKQQHSHDHPHAAAATGDCSCENDYISLTMQKLYEMTDFIICLGITAVTVLLFTLGYYCTANGRKENTLVSKLNIVERSLLASNKETEILKHDLVETLNKLASIEDNSFGSNDMVIALKKELEVNEVEKEKLREQVASLEKELENAAEAGLELNKMVSDLLNNQSGDDSIISSVEELQQQLNEQQNTILEINAVLAEKSRENSELQMLISELNGKYQEELDGLKTENETLLNERNSLQSQVSDAKSIFEIELAKTLAPKNEEIENLTKELASQAAKLDEMLKKNHASEARVEALEETLNSFKKNSNVDIKELLKVTDNKAEVLTVRKERDSLKERLEGEIEARKLLEDHVKIVSEEVSSLKQEYTQSEKEKLEAQTRLEVLSGYFKEKETQLQKELSVKEAMWMKQQGETTSTVERVRLMQDEIQALKSQNDSLRAEIEAQTAAHKAQITSLENRAHETWLAARQSDRKLEEARAEATGLRRKLTSIAGNGIANDVGLQNKVPNAMDGLANHDINQAPSPIHMESPGSPLLGGLPPPPFLPPPFMGPPPPFMSMPPPFMPPGEMRPPPLGRLMSPPPPPPANRYSPSLVDDRDRYTPENGRYTPDSRYNYNTDLISAYETETDFSPPPSPHGRSRGGGGGGGGGGGYSSRERDDRDWDRDRVRERDRNSHKAFSPPPNSDRSKKTKGVLSSGSADSYDSRKGSRGKGKGKK